MRKRNKKKKGESLLPSLTYISVHGFFFFLCLFGQFVCGASRNFTYLAFWANVLVNEYVSLLYILCSLVSALSSLLASSIIIADNNYYFYCLEHRQKSHRNNLYYIAQYTQNPVDGHKFQPRYTLAREPRLRNRNRK